MECDEGDQIYKHEENIDPADLVEDGEDNVEQKNYERSQ